MTRPRLTIPGLSEMKRRGEQIVMVTAYDFPTGRLADRAGVDVVLVGDSGAQVVLGRDSTVAISVDEMIMLSAAVRRGVSEALLLCDVPFGSTELSDAQAVETAIRFVKEAGADAVKIEGATPERLSRIRAITAAGIPVVGHIGLTPQTAAALGGFRAQGRTVETATRFVTEAIAVEQAGAVALVAEAVPSDIATLATSELRIPMIGIGAGPADGQVLVLHDLLGMTEGHTAKFVKQFANIGDDIVAGISAYAAEVRDGIFPASEHQYPVDPQVVEAARLALVDAAARR
ncbi:3-methyl-2-oxobutanoate hydroxymethyltransferase [Leucobacter sp. W1478]|uniref:3-methyl-2-oxobutanoate hydroxymethyltransferase n=1 Tax=Leucobacter sp. W1478 TaxID=3439065 RepID=UPI003F3A16DF